MNILIVHNKDINYYPPVKTLVEILTEIGHSVTILCYDQYGYEKEKQSESNCKVIRLETLRKSGTLGKIDNVFFFRKRVRQMIKSLMHSHDVIWTTTDNTISLIGKELFNYDNHIMQLMELVEDAPVLYYKFLYSLGVNKHWTIHLDRFAKKAKCVVVPEKNRAQILSAMWNLSVLPMVLPNKPFCTDAGEPNDVVKNTLSDLRCSGKKIILYQGVFLKERKLEEFAEAVQMLGGDYLFCIMGRDTEERKKLCEKYPEIVYIPFIAPPYHLLITQLAHIGILTYYPTADNLAGKLNVVYCAPNKIYEYAYSQLPMIGNNIPGLYEPFEKYGIGKCFEKLDAYSIKKAIEDIEQNYDLLKNNCLKFYEDTDMKQLVSNILEVVQEHDD